MARLLGYRKTQAAPSNVKTEREETQLGEESVMPAVASESVPWAPLPCWRLEKIEELEPPPEPPNLPTGQPIGTGGFGLLPGAAARTPPIVSDARLLPVLRSRLLSSAPSRRLDLPALARLWSQGRSVRRIPFEPQRAWASRVTVVVDKSERLIPFRLDQNRLLRRLRLDLGRKAVREVRYMEGFPRPWRCRRRHFKRFPVKRGEPILALSDLGFYGDVPQQAVWKSLAYGQNRYGGDAVALLPCPASRWNPAAIRLWKAIDWSAPTNPSRFGCWSDDASLLQRAENLLSLLAFAVRIEPGLMRAARRLLPPGAADLGTEADAWSHPQLSSRFSLYAEPASEEFRQRLQARFAAQADKLKQEAIAALKAWRRGTPREIWGFEVLALDGALLADASGITPQETASARQAMVDMVATLDGDSSIAPRLRRAVTHYLRRRLDHQPQTVIRKPAIRHLFQNAREVVWDGDGPPPFPRGVGPDVLPPSDQAPVLWQVQQIGSELFVLPAGSAATAGSPLLHLSSANGILSLETGESRHSPQHPLDPATPFPLPQSSTLTLRTDRTVATLRRIHRPKWAATMGRDRFGMWASFEVAGVSQKMRWVPPGRFYMGSPEDEPGRWKGEGPVHLETVREGFWVADTPCTQELWLAVMEENPSHFPSPNRPVEQVSWSDVKIFFEALNERVEGLSSRFPSEAEWEYACRAGTLDATYAGPLEVEGAESGKALEDIAWYGGNSGEGFELEGSDEERGTHPVAEKAPNSWGLYDMLGNVDEWCQDHWPEKYDAEPNPEGTRRVIRGGSWLNFARDVRAAYRFHYEPSVRDSNLGFRLAQGQGALQQGAERAGAEPRSAQRRGPGLEARGAGKVAGKNMGRPPRPKDAAR